MVLAAALDLTSRDSIAAALRATVMRFGGIDALINTAAIYPTPAPGTPAEDVWATAIQINVTSNYVLAEEAGRDPQGAGPARGDRAHQLGQRRRAQGRQRAVRRQQGGDQPSHSRAGDRSGTAGARQWDRAGHGDRRVGDVSPRSRDRCA